MLAILFTDIAKTLKTTALLVLGGGSLFSIIAGLQIAGLQKESLPCILIGILASILCSVTLFGMGHLVENSDEQTEILTQILNTLDPNSEKEKPDEVETVIDEEDYEDDDLIE